MQILFEDSSNIKIGSVNKITASHYLVNTLHGKQQKIKSKLIILTTEDDINVLETELEEAKKQVTEIDVDFLYTCALDLFQENEFDYIELAKEFFASFSKQQQFSVLLALRNNPIYFRKNSATKFKCANNTQVEAAILGLAKRAKTEEQINGYHQTLAENQIPGDWINIWQQLLFDRNNQSIEAKALASFAKKQKLAPAQILYNCGVFSSWEHFYFQKFLYSSYPDQVKFIDEFQEISTKNIDQLHSTISLQENINAFSIDDESTDEIDDAFSVSPIKNGYRVGIHIAAPATWANSNINSQYYQRLKKRIATVYYYSSNNLAKIPLMGERFYNTSKESSQKKSLCNFYSLDQQEQRIVVSLYFNLDFEYIVDYQSVQSKIEIINIQNNLRLQDIEEEFNKYLQNEDPPKSEATEKISKIPYIQEMSILYQISKKLKDERQNQGALFANNKEYRFNIKDGKVTISPKIRYLPVETIVSELMIFANSYWAKLLSDNQIPMIYRIHSSEKVGFANEPFEHKTMAKEVYGWFTSPLRRFVDLCNQQQLIALINGENPSYLPEKLLNGNIKNISIKKRYGFNQQLTEIAMRANIYHNIYNEFQSSIEKYWCLIWLKLNLKKDYRAISIRPNWIEFSDIPLTAKVNIDLSNKQEVNVSIKNINEYELSVDCNLINN